VEQRAWNGGLIVFNAAAAWRGGNLEDAMSRLRIMTAAMAEHFFCGPPVIEVAAIGPSALDPEQVDGVLNLCFGGCVKHDDGVSFHESLRDGSVYSGGGIAAPRPLLEAAHLLPGFRALLRDHKKDTSHGS
jgi:hypothetical protein